MLIAANWKMNLDKQSILAFSKQLQNFKFSKNVKACIFPPMTYIDYLYNLVQNLPIDVGGQNCHFNIAGAFTGETSPIFLKDIGCKYVIIGHSERRIFNKENNEDIKLRAELAINTNLKVILCVGENLIDRKKGNAIQFIEKQILNCLPVNFENSYIAYEPIWSIGTGKIPSVSEIREVHKNIKEIVSKNFNKKIQVIYGGSVNVENINQILSVTEVDGVLVGGASLKVKDFLAIYAAAVKFLNNSTKLQDIK